MDARRRRSLEKVVSACNRALERDAGTSDPHHRGLLADVRALRADLVGELDRAAPPPPAAGP